MVGSDEIIRRACELNPHNWTSEELFMYDQAEKNENDNASCLNQKFYEGIKVGQEKGREEGIQISHEKGRKEREIEVAKNLLKAGISIDVISQTTRLSKAEIEEEIA